MHIVGSAWGRAEACPGTRPDAEAEIRQEKATAPGRRPGARGRRLCIWGTLTREEERRRVWALQWGKVLRAHGGCLGAKGRGRARQDCEKPR